MTGESDKLREGFVDRLRKRETLVGIIGLGYVGLPLALAFAEKGFRVLGFDLDRSKVDKLGRGEGYIRTIDEGRIAEAAASGRFAATADFARLGEPDAVLICVPTPLTPQREPDISYVESTARAIAARLRKGQLVVLESTTYPGTTDELVRGILEAGGLKCGEDFYLAFSPEREDPGRRDFTTTTTPKVVGGVDAVSGDLAQALYDQIIVRTVRVSSARAAEASKLTENVFRAVNIALVNELKIIYDKMGIDVWEVLDAASTKPFGFMRFNPGPGWGGHCLTGSEWVRVRGRGLDGPQRLRDLFDRLKNECDVLATRNGLYLESSGIESLAMDPSSGDVAWFPVSTIYRGRYEGAGVRILTEDNRTLSVTDGHPMLVRGVSGFEVRAASELRDGDLLPVGSDLGEQSESPAFDLMDAVAPGERRRVWVRLKARPWSEFAKELKTKFGWTIRDSIRADSLRLDRFLTVERDFRISRDEVTLLTGKGRARREWPSKTIVTPEFCRLVGYYLSEGCITKERNAQRVRFKFSRDEKEAIGDVRRILGSCGFPTSVYEDKTWHTTTIKASSLLLAGLLEFKWRCGTSSKEMKAPDFMMGLSPDHKRELLAGLLRGDGDVWTRSGFSAYRKNGRLYTHRNATAVVGYFSSSPTLFEQVTLLLQDMGFHPRLKKGRPQLRLQGSRTVQSLASYFCDGKRTRLEEITQHRRRQSPAAGDRDRPAPGLLMTRVKAVESVSLREPVYSLEVPAARSFSASTGLLVHNCIPLDPFYLSWKAREYGASARFIELAGEVNVRMPEFVTEKLALALNGRGRAIRGSKILVLGIAYKKDLGDPRESPAFEIIERLLALGAEVAYHDPHIPVAPKMRSWPDLPPMTSQPLNEEALRARDAVVLVTDHSSVDYGLVARCAPLIVDTRGVYREPRPNVVKA